MILRTNTANFHSFTNDLKFIFYHIQRNFNGEVYVVRKNEHVAGKDNFILTGSYRLLRSHDVFYEENEACNTGSSYNMVRQIVRGANDCICRELVADCK